MLELDPLSATAFASAPYCNFLGGIESTGRAISSSTTISWNDHLLPAVVAVQGGVRSIASFWLALAKLLSRVATVFLSVEIVAA